MEYLSFSDFLDKKVIIVIVALFATVATAAFFPLFFESRLSGAKKFFEHLNKKFDLDLIKDQNDILILRNSIEREFGFQYSIAPLLEDYLKHLTIDTSNATDSEKLRQRYNIIKNIVEEETKEKPFADVPEEERRILKALIDATLHDKQSLEYNLKELATLISARNRIYIRTSKINKWALTLAIVGLITTILLGYMSISQTIDYKKIEEINSKLVDQATVVNKNQPRK